MQWEPISTAPKDGSDVFTASEPRLWIAYGATQRWIDGKWCSDFGKDGWIPTIGQPTHWMPSPPESA
jgi:hypothetical protein